MNNGDYVVIDTSEILYCEADGSYTHFYLKDGKKYTTSNNLKKVESLLHQNTFFRIHRSTLLNINHITNYSTTGEIKISNNKTLMVSSRNKSNFLRVLKLMNNL